jgi:methylglutaconyl-CoA hydratase
VTSSNITQRILTFRAGGTYRMTRLIGPSRAKDLIFGAKLLNAHEAHSLGIVDHLAKEGEDATSHSLKIAEAMAVNGPIALRAAKVAIDRGQLMDVESALDWERACYERCLSSKDRLEGLQAFAEKRKPKYIGE